MRPSQMKDPERRIELYLAEMIYSNQASNLVKMNFQREASMSCVECDTQMRSEPKPGLT